MEVSFNESYLSFLIWFCALGIEIVIENTTFFKIIDSLPIALNKLT